MDRSESFRSSRCPESFRCLRTLKARVTVVGAVVPPKSFENSRIKSQVSFGSRIALDWDLGFFAAKGIPFIGSYCGTLATVSQGYKKLERAMGVEPTTYGLGSRRSATELRPLRRSDSFRSAGWEPTGPTSDEPEIQAQVGIHPVKGTRSLHPPAASSPGLFTSLTSFRGPARSSSFLVESRRFFSSERNGGGRPSTTTTRPRSPAWKAPGTSAGKES